MKRVLLLLAVLCGLLLCAAVSAEEEIRCGVGSWPVGDLGNHRARVRVEQPSDAVWAHITWRRRDAAPQDKNVVVVEAASDKRLANVVRAAITREAGDIIFQAEAAGEYHIYYMPYTASTEAWAYVTRYSPPQDTVDPAWVARHGLTPDGLARETWRNLPRAEVVDIQARTDFDRFDPMEVIATAAEIEDLLARNRGAYLLFPEDREHPIRMTNDLPLRWIRSGPRAEFAGTAQRGEFYAFQVGVYAARKPIDGLGVTFTDLRSSKGKLIAAKSFRCFNLGGRDWLGREFAKPFALAAGKVGPLWFGIEVPDDAAAVEYHGVLTLRPRGLPASTVKLSLTVTSEAARHHGDDDLWRQARLRWLDSTIGLDDEVVAPYTPLRVRGRMVECLNRAVRFAESGLPEAIISNGHQILARPIGVVVESAGSDKGARLAWRGGKVKVVARAPGAVALESENTAAGMRMTCRAKMECDGYINYRVALRAQKAMAMRDIRLEIPIRREVATYMMGLGRTGGYRPKQWQWTWDIARANNSVWIGEVTAGLYCKLKDPQDSWTLGSLQEAGLPDAWSNGGKGGCIVAEESNDVVMVRAYSGERKLKAGETLEFCFGLLITPVKRLDPAHWRQRYYHMYAPPQAAVDVGANIINIHHGNELNPNINYPFLAADKLAAYVKEAHAKGVKVKLYYTVRELSNRVAEMWALRSLGDEIFVAGGPVASLPPEAHHAEAGHSWLHEHLVDHYAPAWHQTLPDGEVDAAIATRSLSRWHNYYLEGLAWLLRETKLDGLYLDGIGCNREIMKRVRKVMDRIRPGCLIDFHSGNDFTFNDRRASPACEYMEHFPYINSLWFGEGYDYNETPDYWLVEISGIPFGLFGEMLQDNGNPWRGMVYGMTARYYSGADPKHIWKLWDEFGIQDAKMLGYWDAACPVRTDHQDVLATAYRKRGKTLVALASWAKPSPWGTGPVRVRLRVDWAALGLRPDRVVIAAPAIPGFQDAATFSPSDLIPVEPGRGWLLIISEQPR